MMMVLGLILTNQNSGDNFMFWVWAILTALFSLMTLLYSLKNE